MEVVKDKIQNYLVNNELEIEKVVKEYSNYIYTIIHNANFNFLEEDIEEIIIDVYLSLWNNKERLNINKSMSSYIAGITKNLMLKKCRNKKQTENIEEYINQLISIENIELDLLQTEQNQLLIEVLEKFKKEDKEIFIFYYYEERKIKEIASIYNMSESKVKSKLFRIRKKLKKVLEKEGMIDNE